MKHRLRANAELDILTPDELREIATEFLPRGGAPQTSRPEASMVLDSSGNGTLALYIVPATMSFALHRLLVDSDAYSPASPFTASGGYVELLRGGVRVDFLDLASGVGQIPSVTKWGSSDGPVWQNLERVDLRFVAGPASTMVVARAQGTLSPFTRE